MVPHSILRSSVPRSRSLFISHSPLLPFSLFSPSISLIFSNSEFTYPSIPRFNHSFLAFVAFLSLHFSFSPARRFTPSNWLHFTLHAFFRSPLPQSLPFAGSSPLRFSGIALAHPSLKLRCHNRTPSDTAQYVGFIYSIARIYLARRE